MDKRKLLDDATQYEYQMVEAHRLRPNTTVWHWSVVPEEHLYEAGYIHSFNKTRLERLARKKEHVDGENRVRDYGFDGLALDNDRCVYDGLQSKYYLSRKVSANDIGTFLAKQIRLTKKNPLSKGYLYSPMGLQEDLRDECKDPDYMIRHVLHNWTPESGPVEATPVVIPECDLPLYDYQEELLDSMESDNGLSALNIPCGMGKTVIAGHHIRYLGPKLIIAMAPLRVSVSNLQKRLACFFPTYRVLLVDSDTGGTNDADEIRAFLSCERPKIIYTTFCSAVDLLADIIAVDEHAYCLVDEVHNLIGNERLVEFVSQFTYGLLMSATLPDEINGELDIEHVHSITFADGIELGSIVDYTLWLPHLDTDASGNTYVDAGIPAEFNSYDADMCAKAFYLAASMLKTGSRRCITYLGSVAECELFVGIARKVFEEYHGLEIWTGQIDCNVTSARREKALEEFQGGDNAVFRILASVRILDEAVDVPRCDSVFITKVGEASSDIRMMQRIMRSGRLDKTNPTKRNNIFLWATGWEQCIGSLELLREADPEFHKKVRINDSNYNTQDQVGHDDMIRKERANFMNWSKMKCVDSVSLKLLWVDKIKAFYDKYGEEPRRHGKRDDGYESNLNSRIAAFVTLKNKNLLPEPVEKYINTNLPWFIWNKMEIHRITMIQSLKDFYEKYKRHPKESDNETKLLSFVSNVRTRKRLGNLDSGLEYKINTILPWFEWAPNTKYHPEMVEKLRMFYETFGSSPMNGGKRIGEKELSTYINNRRSNKKAGNLETDLEKLINEKLPWFKWDPIEQQHLETIDEILRFYNKYGHEPKHLGKKTDETRLAAYMGMRRQQKRTGKLDIELENLIKEKLPFVRWNIGFVKHHTEMVGRLKEFYDLYGECPSASGPRENELELFTWISERRKNKKKGNLCKETEKLIETELPWFVWDALEDNHNSKLKSISDYYNTHKRMPLRTSTCKKEKEMIKYLDHRRGDKKLGNLDAALEAKITKALPWLRWDPIMDEHIKIIGDITTFYDTYGEKPKHGGTRLNEAKYAAWIFSRRKNKRDGILSVELEKMIMDALPWADLNMKK